MKFFALLPLAALLLSCGQDGARFRIQLDIKETYALNGVETIRVTASGPDMTDITAEAPRASHEVVVPPIPLGVDRVVEVEGLDVDSVAVAEGKSAPFDLTADAPDTVTVPFSRCTSTVYKDGDGDGYGTAATAKTACASSLSGYVDKKGDCADSDEDVYPGQTGFFTQPVSGTQSYDYDCDGTEEPEDATVADCANAGPACKGEGWASLPGCGQSGTWVVCEKISSVCEDGPGTTKTLACR